jgi:tRNA G18 (ribose-2'-O)-methylase SpoU
MLDPPIDETPEAIKAALAPLRNGLSVAVHTPGNPFAVGTIIRTCHSYLVREVLLIGSEPYYQKASMGMHKLENVVKLADDEAFFAHVAGRPVWALEREQARRSLYGVHAFPEGVVLVLGSERFGYPPGFLERCDEVVGIPLYGVNNSLPVVVAAGIALAWWAHLRYADGALVLGPRRDRS